MDNVRNNEGASAPSTFRMFRYPSTDKRNPTFDGDNFITSWATYVGSSHRHWQTGELILCWSINGPHPQQRETLRARLESHPGNIGSVLAALDCRMERWNAAIERGAIRRASGGN